MERGTNGGLTSIPAEAEERGLSIPMQQKEQLKNAAALAQDVAKIVKENGLSRSFKAGAKEHVYVEGWLTISRVNNEAPHAKVEAVETHGEHEVVKARAWITDAHGATVSEADGYCSTEEANWRGKPFYARASMAQTRAIGKAMRLRHAWVMVMAGFSPTPAEEMDGVDDIKPTKATVKSRPATTPTPEADSVPASVTDAAEPAPEPSSDRPENCVKAGVSRVSKKSGEKNGKAWTRFGIEVTTEDGRTFWANTFDTKHGEVAQKCADAGVNAWIATEEGKPFNGAPSINLTYIEAIEGA